MTFSEEKTKNCFEAKDNARRIDLVVIKMGWKAAVTKKFLKVAILRIVALKFVCGANIDQPLDAVKEV